MQRAVSNPILRRAGARRPFEHSATRQALLTRGASTATTACRTRPGRVRRWVRGRGAPAARGRRQRDGHASHPSALTEGRHSPPLVLGQTRRAGKYRCHAHPRSAGGAGTRCTPSPGVSATFLAARLIRLEGDHRPADRFGLVEPLTDRELRAGVRRPYADCRRGAASSPDGVAAYDARRPEAADIALLDALPAPDPRPRRSTPTAATRTVQRHPAHDRPAPGQERRHSHHHPARTPHSTSTGRPGRPPRKAQPIKVARLV